MSLRHRVDPDGRYDGQTLQELWPEVVREIIEAVDPLEVILFGSVARGQDGPDSDIDVLVVLDTLLPDAKRPTMAQIRSAIRTFVPVDVLVTDPTEIARQRDNVGSMLYWPLREGRTVYTRPRARAV